jgi:hypothetical protein
MAVRIPYDGLLFQRAVNEGTPVVRIAASSPPAQRFMDLAALVLGEDAPSSGTERRRRRFFGRGS